MRSILAGLFILLLSAACLADTTGEVESIGFGGTFRPDCWTQMVVRLAPGKLDPGTYQIQVEQKDGDEDKQVFTRAITVNAGDQAKEQRFWMYFMPETVNQGLDYNGQSISLLNREMKVWLCTESGKQISPLPITSGIRNVDKSSRLSNPTVSTKFVLCVSDGSSRPQWQDYVTAYGVTEDIEMVPVRPEDLPENVLGYDGVDAIVWMSGDAGVLTAGASSRLRAMTEYVRLGGKLVVTQPAERGKVEALDGLLPIKLKDAAGNWLIEMRDRATLTPLSTWAKPKAPAFSRDPWKLASGPFKVARATALRPGARVTETIDWNDATAAASQDITPYLARWGVGLGEVVWVAQNLGDPNITMQVSNGWIGVWDRIFEIKDEPQFPAPQISPEFDPKIKDFVTDTAAKDLGGSFIGGIEHDARGAALVTLAVGFFIIYWALAGPVSYLILANKKRKGLSWPIFALSAIVATLLTVGVVKFVLGASADIHHVTFVRIAPGQPAIVESRLGIYLTKSSDIAVALQKTDPTYVSYVAAFAPHPSIQGISGGGKYVNSERYTIPITETATAEAVEISVPFRSTLKKLQARWIGQLPGIDGDAKLTEASETSPSPHLAGKLINSTGRDLSGIYFAFTSRNARGDSFDDYVFYVPKWPKDGVIDLDKEVTALRTSVPLSNDNISNGAKPGDGKVIGDRISSPDDGWNQFWANGMRASPDEMLRGDLDRGYVRSFPMASLYERLPVTRKWQGVNTRYDLARYGARHFDMSQSMAAGELVILAQDAANDDGSKGSSPLPYPLEVDHDKVVGTGVTFFQITLPLPRVQPKPTTQQLEK